MAEARRDRTGGPPVAALRVIRALRAFANDSERYVGAAGREAEMHRTDLSGLAAVMDRGDAGAPATPGQLSTALQLSAPATSAMLDRLERLGHVTRRPHPTDRRSVVVEMTDHARDVGGAMFARLATHMAPVLARRTDAELALIATFLEEAGEATRAASAEIPPH